MAGAVIVVPSPQRGRGLRYRFNDLGWVRGNPLTHSPSSKLCVALSPVGERAQMQAPASFTSGATA